MSLGIVTLNGDTEVDSLITPLRKGEMVAPGAYHDMCMHFKMNTILFNNLLFIFWTEG